MILGNNSFQTMKKSHSSSNIQGKSECLCSVNNYSSALMKKSIERTPSHILINNDQIWGRITAAYYWQDIWMGKDPVIRKS
ncbi:hypothetical protein C0J52_16571 [Blattella germanica]|nr:hypothetical protein C0J52_16571 [Blattella germanica]